MKFSFIILITGVLFIPVFCFAQTGSWALEFDGLNDKIEILDATELDLGSGDFTIELWARPEPDYQQMELLHKMYDWTIGYTIVFNHWFSENLYFSMYVSDGIDDAEPKITAPFSEKWYHIVGVRETTDFRLYIDSVLVDTATTSLGSLDTDEDLTIAWEPDSDYYKGLIDGIRIYGRALSTGEVEEHYAGVYSDETALRGLWAFENGTGTIAYDTSGNGNNGTIIGATWYELPIEFALFSFPINFVSYSTAYAGEVFTDLLPILALIFGLVLGMWIIRYTLNLIKKEK